MAGRAEQIELNRGGSCAEVSTHDVLGPLGVHSTTTELTRSRGPRVRILLPPPERLRTFGPFSIRMVAPEPAARRAHGTLEGGSRPLTALNLIAPASAAMVPIVQLSPAEAAHMSDPQAETAEPGCAVKSRPTVEAATVEAATVEAATMQPSEPMEATGAKTEAGEPAEGIAVAIIRPVVVTRPALGIVAATRPDTAVTRGERVSGRADRNRSGGVRRRSA
jgi:hypothetical protein